LQQAGFASSAGQTKIRGLRYFPQAPDPQQFDW
jgi:hypothetical protein